MSIGLIMFCKAIVLALVVSAKDRYESWKVARRRNGISLSFDGRTYYDPIIRWERRARKAWVSILIATPIICIIFVALLFTQR